MANKNMRNVLMCNPTNMKNYRIRKITTTNGQNYFFVEKRAWKRFLLIPCWFYWKEYLCNFIQPFKTLTEAEQVFEEIQIISESKIIAKK